MDKIANIIFLWVCAILLCTILIAIIYIGETYGSLWVFVTILSVAITLIGYASAVTPYDSPYASFKKWLMNATDRT
jgi:hypothetical protein